MISNRSTWFCAFPVAMAGLVGCGAAGGSYNQSPASASKGAPAMEMDMASPGQASQPQAPPAPAGIAGAERGQSNEAGGAKGTFQDSPRPSPESRPGLGTQWGETRTSRISSAPFSRADSTTPFALASLFYNDAEGAKAMASATGFREFSTGSVDIGNGVATMSLKDADTGRFLTGFEAASKSYVVGAAGQRYTIVVQSNVPARLEVIVSVDGLDVLDGKAGSFSKRGYLIEPNGRVEIDGFRQSVDAVAAFRFGSVRDSYAQKKTGDARNVGVIGIALFNEQGTNPAGWTRGEVQRRLDADPFPGRFATPPH